MKKIFLRILVLLVSVVLVFSPYLLVIDFEKYSPVVLIIWVVSIAYYLMMKRRERIMEKYNEEKRKMESENDESPPDDVSRETN